MTKVQLWPGGIHGVGVPACSFRGVRCMREGSLLQRATGNAVSSPQDKVSISRSQRSRGEWNEGSDGFLPSLASHLQLIERT